MIRILALNCGSSSLKFKLIQIHNAKKGKPNEQSVIEGLVENIGKEGIFHLREVAREEIRKPVTISDHGDAMSLVLDSLREKGYFEKSRIDALGHRVVHGGDRFVGPTLIDNEVIDRLEALSFLAPLHNPPCLKGIKTAKEILKASLPQVAVFDTAFHTSLPEQASHYAIPYSLAEKNRIRRYGFHGLAHSYMAERFSSMTSTPLDKVRIITLQLGNGCSAAAIQDGRSIDTSMGFTPLEGLMMGTRAGDMDPYLPGFLMRQEKMGIDEAEEILNKKSGLLGVSGLSSDMRVLLEAEEGGNRRAALAMSMFCYRIRKYIGAYLAVLNGAQAVIFGGGIGENAPTIRSRICSGFEWCGLIMDPIRNKEVIGTEGHISSKTAKIHVYVVPVDETLIIAKETYQFLYEKSSMSR
ncbi:MAG: acetate/propionate family kinase [bacterium]